MGNIRASMSGARRENVEYGRSFGYLNSQLRAFATTWRYAVAGTVLYGAFSQVQKLSEMQRQLGLISAIGIVQGPQGKGIELVGDRLQKLGEKSRQTAIDVIQPISNVNASIINLLSTVSNVPQNEIVPMVRDIGRAAQLAQINAEDATKAFTTMNVAFGKDINLRNVHRTAQEFFMLIRRAPGGAAAGPQIITQLGQLAQTALTARISQPDMFAMLTSTLRAGIPPSQAGRGLQFLFQTIANPSLQTKSAQEAFRSIGITPTVVKQIGGRRVLSRIISEVQRRGGIRPAQGTFQGLQTRLGALEEQLGEEGELPPGLISGPASEFAGRLFRRIHAFRTFVALYVRATRQGTFDDPNLRQEIEAFGEAEKDHVRRLENLNQAWKKFETEATLPKAAQALSTLGLDIATAFQPIMNFAARRVVIPGQKRIHSFLADHGNEFMFGTIGLLAALASRRGIRGMLGAGGRTAGLGFALRDISGERDPTTGEFIRGSSPTHPLYVTVVNTLFGPGARAPTPVPIPGPPGAPGRAGRFGRLGRLGRAGLGIAGVVTAYELAKAIAQDEKDDAAKTQLLDYLNEKVGGFGGRTPLGFAIPTIGAHRRRRTPAEQAIFDALEKHYISKEVAEHRLRMIASPEHLRSAHVQRIQVAGQAKVNLDINVKQLDGTIQKRRASIPVPLYPDFTNPFPVRKAPQTRGQDAGKIPRGT
jgi:hypothetical protein